MVLEAQVSRKMQKIIDGIQSFRPSKHATLPPAMLNPVMLNPLTLNPLMLNPAMLALLAASTQTAAQAAA
jgi:hypothetical protein